MAEISRVRSRKPLVTGFPTTHVSYQSGWGRKAGVGPHFEVGLRFKSPDGKDYVVTLTQAEAEHVQQKWAEGIAQLEKGGVK